MKPCPKCDCETFILEAGCSTCHYGEKEAKALSKKGSKPDAPDPMGKPKNRQCEWMTGNYHCPFRMVGRTGSGPWLCSFHCHMHLRRPTANLVEIWGILVGWSEWVNKNYTPLEYPVEVFFHKLHGVPAPALTIIKQKGVPS